MRFDLRSSSIHVRSLVLLPFTFAVVACGAGPVSDVAIEEQAAGSQALIEGGDTMEEAGDGEGEASGAGEDVVDDDVALDEAAEGECKLVSLRERVIARYDTDGNGTLSQEERTELRADVEDHPRARRALERHRMVRRVVGKRVMFIYDADKSGSLDDAERALLKSDLEARCLARQARILERYDIDGDGTLDDTERAQARTDREARIAARRAEILARFDANNSGRLEDVERQALRADIRERMAAKRAELKALFDVDNNGTLDDEEAAALREHLRARIRLELAADAETEI